MGADRVVSVHFGAHWIKNGGPKHVLDVIGQCFSIAQANMSSLWRADSNPIIEPDVAAFAYDAFERSPEIIKTGEAAARAVLPMLSSWVEKVAEKAGPVVVPASRPAVPETLTREPAAVIA